MQPTGKAISGIKKGSKDFQGTRGDHKVTNSLTAAWMNRPQGYRHPHCSLKDTSWIQAVSFSAA
jgi:hypothetical protein